MQELMDMFFPWGVLVVGVVFVLLVLAVLLGLRRREVLRYEKISHLFTPAEFAFLEVLEEVLDDGYRVFGKVRCADVLQVSKGLEASEWRKLFNRIQSKHFDYVVCREEDCAIMLAIELDDRSHERRDRRERDAFLDEAMEVAGLPLLRIPCQRQYPKAELRKLLRSHLP